MKKLPFSLRLFAPLYQLAWRFARPVLGRHKRLADGWPERLVPESWGHFAFCREGPEGSACGKTVWIQAASGGEAYLAAHLARRLCLDWPSGQGCLRILATTCTRQGMDVLERYAREKEEDNAAGDSRVEFLPRFFPLDEPRLMSRALEQAKPAQIVLLETELWPGLLLAARASGVPVLVLNGRITPKSMAGYGKLPSSLWRELAPERVLAISGGDAERFAALFGAERVGQMPNIKFDLIRFEPVPGGFADGGDVPPAPEGRPVAQVGRVALFASVRKQEAAQVGEAVRALKERAPSTWVVLAPRHLHHVGVWQRQMERVGFYGILRSELAADEAAAPAAALAAAPGLSGENVLIWDRFGELNQLYARASAAYVGGSLVPLGGQNFLEALGAGLTPCIGPYIDNFAWAGDAVLQMTRRASDAAALAAALAAELAAPRPRAEVAAEFVKRVEANRGGTAAAVQAMLELLCEDS